MGTNYSGWQIQHNTRNTIQQILNEKFSRVLSENIYITGCGRTDTGVHARDFYAHFDSEKNDLHVDPRIWLFRINNTLPKDIYIKQIIPVKEAANARFDAYSRTYRYYVTRVRDPFAIDLTAYMYRELDINLMNEGAKLLMTYTDFSSFKKSNTQVKTNDCKLTEAFWTEENNLLVFTITSNRFLRNMVRAIVGTLLRLGEGKITLSQFKQIIEDKKRSNACFSAPASGLFLEDIKYHKEIFV